MTPIAFTPAWRNFKRMQDLTVVASCLIYAAARLPLAREVFLRWMVIYPAGYLILSLLIPLAIPPVKRWLGRYVWMSFQAGFGQTAVSILTGVVLLLAAGGFIYWQVAQAAARGLLGANVFCAYASGIGILAAQARLVRSLEQIAEVREKILLR